MPTYTFTSLCDDPLHKGVITPRACARGNVVVSVVAVYVCCRPHKNCQNSRPRRHSVLRVSYKYQKLRKNLPKFASIRLSRASSATDPVFLLTTPTVALEALDERIEANWGNFFRNF